MSGAAPRRVVVTGLGAVTPAGIGTGPFWDLIIHGDSAIRKISCFDATEFRSKVAGECDFDPQAHGIDPAEAHRLDRAGQFAYVAARQAIADSGLDLDRFPKDRIGVSMGSALGRVSSFDHWTARRTTNRFAMALGGADGRGRPLSEAEPSVIAQVVAQQAGARGPVRVVSNGCTSGLDAVSHGVQLIEDGQADVVIAGGSEAPLTPVAVSSMDAIRATSAYDGDPAEACRPFDRNRDGMVVAEAAGVLVLEEAGSARNRGAVVLAEMLGCGHRANAHHMTGLEAEGSDLADAVQEALHTAKVAADDVDYVNAHGTATGHNDEHETAALKQALGSRAFTVPISSIKSMVGHALGAAGAIELIACAMAIRDNLIPPTANLYDPDPKCDLDYVPLIGREHRTDIALCTGSGFGGLQTAILMGAPGGGR
ncbi:beta-ketoacyl-[acyl-carrier-protein] synthase family protein [Actinomadura citrea]|jgi:act minimal PKS ketosynthase (KS/KS alpha)|uniref:Act minimal PKS ketosynthase (KS/KS alpha) n=1 Tax=Actinomadura citrea TaxID=46158 RepID=A0A7Y9GJC3_9ACTN|nr:beta-ketoacyl-[acyl-carrier-protein] synthase family protein [Actinomadura citrea]NYE17597.1 act minimal PKS ketosynthase (KS/KS alpha) [Actinomadura citrea]GGU03463.1 beta-ACP synthase [Actinomadura citrea]